MSFIIAISRDNEAVIASDGRTTKEKQIISENYEKIHKIIGETPIFIGIGGSIGLSKIVLNEFYSSPRIRNSGKNSLKSYAEELLSITNQIIKERSWDSQDINNKYILIKRATLNDYADSEIKPLFEICTLDSKKNSIESILSLNGGYTIAYCNSPVIDKTIINPIINKHYNNETSLVEIATRIIEEISTLDYTVNNHIHIEIL